LFTNPSPFIPLPFIRGEGTEFLKGAPPLLIPSINKLYSATPLKLPNLVMRRR
jgi:hypothetical protein